MDQHPESASEPIRNRVDESGLIALDLDDLMPVAPVLEFDLADYLEMGWVLKEKAFRAAMRELDAPKWAGSTVALYCSSDAIVPDWAWMLATSRLTTLGAHALVGSPEVVRVQMLMHAIEQLDLAPFQDGRVVIKGCSSGTTAEALALIIRRLQPHAQSLFYGEPCSTVPVYKRPKNSD